MILCFHFLSRFFFYQCLWHPQSLYPGGIDFSGRCTALLALYSDPRMAQLLFYFAWTTAHCIVTLRVTRAFQDFQLYPLFRSQGCFLLDLCMLLQPNQYFRGEFKMTSVYTEPLLPLHFVPHVHFTSLIIVVLIQFITQQVSAWVSKN